MPLAEKTSGLARSDSSVAEAGLPPSGMPAFSPTSGSKHAGKGEEMKCDEPLALKVDTLATEFAQIKALHRNLQPISPCTAAVLL